ncbi:MAG: DNA/RNA non-specific endonuclease [Novosphingobium sp.]
MAKRSDNSASDLARKLIGEAAGGGRVSESAGFPGGAEEAAAAAGPYVPANIPEGFSTDEVVAVSDKIGRGEALGPREDYITEAIILPDLRPAIDVLGGSYDTDHPQWRDYVRGTPAHAVFTARIPAVGRIEIPGHPSAPYGGTGFVVGPNLVMTNRHVARIFTSGLGQRSLVLDAEIDPGIDFDRERGSTDCAVLGVRRVVMIHPYWDMALLEVEGLGERPVLSLGRFEPSEASPRRIGVIGYPAFDSRNDAAVQNEVFRGVYNIKRFQPGLWRGRREIESFGKDVPAGTHDSSTLGGNSGSAVVDALTGLIAGLHFGGLYKDSNFAVPAIDLARDGRVIDAGVAIEGGGRRESGAWDQWWARADAAEAPAAAGGGGGGAGPGGGQAQSASAGGRISLTVPLHIDISLGDPQLGASARLAAGEAAEEGVEPIHDGEEVPRKGYDPMFLGVKAPPPKVRRPAELATLADGSAAIPYHNFSVTMHKARRLALFTAANIDASLAMKEPEPGRNYTRKGLTGLGEADREKWFNDPRLRGTEQLPDKFFDKDRGAFDKGHLVRREDVAWGRTFAEVQAANGDTYHVTNCSPQIAKFNRSNHADNWGALEDLVLKQAASERYCLFSGPVLAADDPVFKGKDDSGATQVQIPRRYWKVVVAVKDGRLKTFAFVLEQDLANTPMEFTVPDTWKRHQVSLARLETMLGSLTFAKALHRGDALAGAPGSEAPQVEEAIAQIAAMEPGATEAVTESAEGHGRFEGLPIQSVWGDDGRSMRLLAPISYVEEAGREWPAPKDAWLDGASIPRAFWSVIGGPFEGRYREASVVHDYYCDHPERTWRDTHRMFHAAMLCRGVPGFKARIMFYAVYRFGPRWPDPGSVEEAVAMPAEALGADAATSLLADAETLRDNPLSVEEIEELADRHRQ